LDKLNIRELPVVGTSVTVEAQLNEVFFYVGAAKTPGPDVVGFAHGFSSTAFAKRLAALFDRFS
jgi:hypothetical protein